MRKIHASIRNIQKVFNGLRARLSERCSSHQGITETALVAVQALFFVPSQAEQHCVNLKSIALTLDATSDGANLSAQNSESGAHLDNLEFCNSWMTDAVALAIWLVDANCRTDGISWMEWTGHARRKQIWADMKKFVQYLEHARKKEKELNEKMTALEDENTRLRKQDWVMVQGAQDAVMVAS
jgi:hypothetical protein